MKLKKISYLKFFTLAKKFECIWTGEFKFRILPKIFFSVRRFVFVAIAPKGLPRFLVLLAFKLRKSDPELGDYVLIYS